jgi:carbon-monoxide dehydrogenase medium subunit
MISHEFTYLKPTNLMELARMKAEFEEKAMLLAGGTDLVVFIKEGLAKPTHVLDVKRIAELRELSEENHSIFIGAGVTFTELLESKVIKEKLPLLWQCSHTVASVGVRNRATLTGNICSAIPSLDSAPALLVYDSVVHLLSSQNERKISIHEWFLAPRKTAIQPDEIITKIEIPVPNQSQKTTYEKLGRYKGEDLAQAGIGIYADEALNYRLAACAVAPIPARLRKTEVFLQGKKLSSELLEKAAEILLTEISPITDIRSSAQYRNHMMQVMLKRGLENVYAQVKGGEK